MLAAQSWVAYWATSISGAHAPKSGAMARPRAFNEADVLDAAMRCFWARGYQATSVRDLAEHMGITCASLYNAFGDKRALFRRALERYLDDRVRDRIARLGALPPRAAIGAYFREVLDRLLSDRQRRGCMMVNCALDVAPHNATVRRIISAEFSEIEGFFRHCIERGQADGSISRVQAPSDLARHLLAIVLGLPVLARTRPERSLLEAVVRPALALLSPETTEIAN